MIIQDLNQEEQSFLDHLLASDTESIISRLHQAEKPSDESKHVLSTVKSMLEKIGLIWNSEHNKKGELVVTKETITNDEFILVYEQIKPIFELIRARLPILRSIQVGVGTLVNIHEISELIELSIREKGYLTYYWGSSLTTDKIKELEVDTPTDIIVLSLMAVNDDLNGFDELIQLRKTFPKKKIIVGGSAFPMFSLLKEDKNHPFLTNPYKNNLVFTEELMKSNDLNEFVKKIFNVKYCETIEQILQEIDLIV
jgi:hypothetical protein